MHLKFISSRQVSGLDSLTETGKTDSAELDTLVETRWTDSSQSANMAGSERGESS